MSCQNIFCQNISRQNSYLRDELLLPDDLHVVLESEKLMNARKVPCFMSLVLVQVKLVLVLVLRRVCELALVRAPSYLRDLGSDERSELGSLSRPSLCRRRELRVHLRGGLRYG